MACRLWTRSFRRSRRRWRRRRECCPVPRSRAGAAAGPVVTLAAGERGAAALRVDDAELAVLASLVGRGQPLDRLLGGHAIGEARARPARSEDSRRPGSPRLPPAAPPRGRPSRRRETWIASPPPASSLEVAGGDRVRRDPSSHTSRPTTSRSASSSGTTTDETSGLRRASSTPASESARIDRSALVERSSDRCVVEPVEHECAVEIDFALDRDLRHPAPRRPEPALPHTSMVWPGSMTSSSTSVS